MQQSQTATVADVGRCTANRLDSAANRHPDAPLCRVILLMFNPFGEQRRLLGNAKGVIMPGPTLAELAAVDSEKLLSQCSPALRAALERHQTDGLEMFFGWHSASTQFPVDLPPLLLSPTPLPFIPFV